MVMSVGLVIKSGLTRSCGLQSAAPLTLSYQPVSRPSGSLILSIVAEAQSHRVTAPSDQRTRNRIFWTLLAEISESPDQEFGH